MKKGRVFNSGYARRTFSGRNFFGYFDAGDKRVGKGVRYGGRKAKRLQGRNDLVRRYAFRDSNFVF